MYLAAQQAGLLEKEIENTIASAFKAAQGSIRSLPRRDIIQTIPNLPAEVQAKSDLGDNACPWLDGYIEFSRQMSPRGYDGFHEAIALWLLSTIAARRLVLMMGNKKFFSQPICCLMCSYNIVCQDHDSTNRTGHFGQRPV